MPSIADCTKFRHCKPFPFSEVLLLFSVFSILVILQISSLELDSLDSSTQVEPEKIAPIFHKLRRKEKALRTKAHDLESKLEMSETHCYNLVEENCDLKTAIEGLEQEIGEVNLRLIFGKV